MIEKGSEFFHKTYTQQKKNGFGLFMIFSMKDFLPSEIVLDGHDELEISQLSLLLSSGRTSNETRLGEVSQVWSAGARLIHLHIHTHAHTKYKNQ